MEENINEKDYLSLKETAKLLGISEKLMSRLSHEKGFPCIRFGKRVVVCKEAIPEFIKTNSNKFIK